MANGNGGGREQAYLPARVLQALGILLLVAAFVFWAFTGQESPLFVGAAMTLISIGSYQGLRVSVKMEREEAERDRRELRGEDGAMSVLVCGHLAAIVVGISYILLGISSPEAAGQAWWAYGAVSLALAAMNYLNTRSRCNGHKRR